MAIVRRMDTNGNWHVSFEEFSEFLNALTPSPKPIGLSGYIPRNSLSPSYVPDAYIPDTYVPRYEPRAPYRYWDPLLGRYIYDNPYYPKT